MRPQGLDDFLNIFELLGREEGVVQQPVICLTVFVLGTQQFDCGIQQLKHFVAAFNALGMMLNREQKNPHLSKQMWAFKWSGGHLGSKKAP